MKTIILFIFLLSSCVPQSRQPEKTVQAESDSNHLPKHDKSNKPIPQEIPTDYNKREKQCIELTLPSTTYPKSCDGIQVSLTNYSSQPLSFGKVHYFEFYNHGKWERICFDKGGIVYAFDAIGYELPPSTSQKMYYSLNQKLHTYIPGKYRIYVPFRFDGKEDYRTVEFILE